MTSTDLDPVGRTTLRAVGSSCLATTLLLAACGEASSPAAPPQPAAASAPSSPIRFVERTREAGIEFERESGASGDFFYVVPMSGGAIFFDADGDGDPDLYLLNGALLNTADDGPRATNAFYLNDGQGRFTDATEAAGLGDTRFSVGVCGADYDNDGDLDLFVTNFGAPHALWRNDGDARFTDVFEGSGLVAKEFLAASPGFADVDGDGLLDLYIANCLDHSLDHNPVCELPRADHGNPLRRFCTPKTFEPVADQLFRNLGDGTFADISEESGIASRAGRSLGLAFADFDGDGDQDILVACDQSPNQLLINDGQGHFEERAFEAGVALGPDGTAQAGMGITAADWNGDERVDVAVTYFEAEWNGFYLNEGENRFVESARRNGTLKPGIDLMGWGLEFFDADLDADLDVLIANGHLQDDIHLIRTPVAGYEQPNLFFENRGADGFVSLEAAAGPGLELERVSRGLITADIDLDGDVDALVVNLQGPPTLLINETPRADRHWLGVRLVGTRSNRSAVGARLVLRLPGSTLVREVRTAHSYLSQSDLVQHFGLGPHDRVETLEIHWPSGQVTRELDLVVDRVVELTEPE